MHTPFLSVLLSSPLVLGFPAASKVARSYGDLGLELPKELADKWYDPFDAKSNHTTPKDPGSVYSCAGPNMDNYPKKQEWLSFEQMWAINEPVMKERNKGEDYGELIRKAIEEVSTESKVDSRLILAIIMQESTGGVHVQCTGGGTDCGLMQFRGGSTFKDDDPEGSILQMLRDAVFGAAGKPGYYHYFTGEELTWISPEFYGNPYAAAHLYNGGSISSPNLNIMESGVEPSKSYANDIASRLIGWDGSPEGCKISAGEGEGENAEKCKSMNLRSIDVCGA